MNRKKINDILEPIYKRGWKTVFNDIDKIYTDKVLDIASEFEILRQDSFSNIIVEGYNLNYEMLINKNNIDADTLFEYLNRNNELVQEYNNLLEKMNKQLIIECDKIRAFDDEIEDIVLPYTRYVSDAEELFIRLGVLKAKFFNMLISFDFNKIGEDNYILKENVTLIRQLRRKILDKIFDESNFDEQNNNNQKEKNYDKIFDYKQMNKLAESNNYKFARFKGDHKIYVHSQTNKIVVIPQHDLKYGIMCGLQRQIKLNAIK